MKTTNYFDTFISVSEDCPANVAEIPKGDKTIARMQYELIKSNPYKYTSDDILFRVFAQRNNIAAEKEANERERFFSKGNACMRSSPLVKRYGWGVHYNQEGLAAIYPIESPEYQEFVKNKTLKHLKGMRSKRG